MQKIMQLPGTDLPIIKNLLLESDLPVDDIELATIHFYGIKFNGKLIAVGALEQYGSDAILRSIAIAKNFQNIGHGKQLLEFLETEARDKGIDQLFLLTTTAKSYFQKFAYQIHNRNDCPKAILASAEFSNICPSEAVCLTKRIS